MTVHKTIVALKALVVLGFVLPACAEGEAPLDDRASIELRQGALTAEQCTFFAEDDQVTICKATRSARNPFVIIRTSTEGCINGIADQDDGSYIAIDDPTCEGLGCFPEGAPYDGTVACCDGLAPGADGTCADVDACVDNPCDAEASCTDLAPPALNDPDGRICECQEGFEGSGEPGDCAPASGLLLDMYPGASGAFSLRKLRAAYDGPAFLIRRSFDHATMAIGFTEEGDLDTEALVAFIREPYGDTVEWPAQWNATAQQYADAGIGNGYVVRWYDQSEEANGRYAFESTRVEQHGVAMAGMYVGAVQTFFENRTKRGMALSSAISVGTAFTLARVQEVTTLNYLAFGPTGGIFYDGTHFGRRFGMWADPDTTLAQGAGVGRVLGYFNVVSGVHQVG